VGGGWVDFQVNEGGPLTKGATEPSQAIVTRREIAKLLRDARALVKQVS
jgi:hypothetical protein